MRTVLALVYHYQADLISASILKTLLKDNLKETKPAANETPERRNLWRSLTYDGPTPHSEGLAEYNSAVWQSDITLTSTALLLRALALAQRTDMPWPLGIFPKPSERALIRFLDIVVGSLSRYDDRVRRYSASALVAILRITPGPVAIKYPYLLIKMATENPTATYLDRLGIIHALGLVFALFKDFQKYAKPSNGKDMRAGIPAYQAKIIRILLGLTGPSRLVEVKCAALQSLATGPMADGGKLRRYTLDCQKKTDLG